jgi:hypothetical protein
LQLTKNTNYDRLRRNDYFWHREANGQRSLVESRNLGKGILKESLSLKWYSKLRKILEEE